MKVGMCLFACMCTGLSLRLPQVHELQCAHNAKLLYLAGPMHYSVKGPLGAHSNPLPVTFNSPVHSQYHKSHNI